MNFLEIAQTRQSCRAYEAALSVEQEKLAAVLEAARLAPSACNAQPYHFTVCRGEAAKAAAKACQGLGMNKFASQAPVLIVISEQPYSKSAAMGAKVKNNDYRSIDIGITTAYLTAEATARVVSALVLLPNGVQTMSMDIPGLVQTSLNLGVLRLREQEMAGTFAVRSALATEKAMLCRRIERLAELLGGSVTYTGDYPGWEYLRDSKLRELVADVYREQTGREPVIEAIHAGLECGVFAGKLPGLYCVSIGPDMQEIHTPRERLNVASTQRTWALVCEVLRRAKEL